MPGTTHRVRDHQAFAERSAVMGAGGADREHLPAMAGEQDLFIADLPNQYRAIGEIAVRDSIPQVEFVGLAGFRHVTLRRPRTLNELGVSRKQSAE